MLLAPPHLSSLPCAATTNPHRLPPPPPPPFLPCARRTGRASAGGQRHQQRHGPHFCLLCGRLLCASRPAQLGIRGRVRVHMPGEARYLAHLVRPGICTPRSKGCTRPQHNTTQHGTAHDIAAWRSAVPRSAASPPRLGAPTARRWAACWACLSLGALCGALGALR